MSQSSISYLWREPEAAKGFAMGVSLHSHTNQSKETLDFLAELSHDVPFIGKIMAFFEDRSEQRSGIRPNFKRSYWTPPLTPKLAFDLEQGQIHNRCNLEGLVSITDHDDITAPMLLRSLDSARHIPVSLEWTVPFGCTAFHLGIHNLPSAAGQNWMNRFAAFTAIDVTLREPKLLTEMLEELAELPNVLIVFNHPNWDLYRVGAARHDMAVNEFMAVHGQYIHALELNGLRQWKENAEVSTLAGKWNQLVISGGDRHGVEPNANINLTHATSFNEFVHEVRRERRSNILFMPQYAEPWKHRILQSTLAALRNYPQFPEGSRRWDERVFHPDTQGVIRPLSTLWNGGAPPRVFTYLIYVTLLTDMRPVSRGLRYAWDDSGDMRTVLAKLDA